MSAIVQYRNLIGGQVKDAASGFCRRGHESDPIRGLSAGDGGDDSVTEVAPQTLSAPCRTQLVEGCH